MLLNNKKPYLFKAQMPIHAKLYSTITFKACHLQSSALYSYQVFIKLIKLGYDHMPFLLSLKHLSFLNQ